jgi:hypothetical protein
LFGWGRMKRMPLFTKKPKKGKTARSGLTTEPTDSCYDPDEEDYDDEEDDFQPIGPEDRVEIAKKHGAVGLGLEDHGLGSPGSKKQPLVPDGFVTRKTGDRSSPHKTRPGETGTSPKKGGWVRSESSGQGQNTTSIYGTIPRGAHPEDDHLHLKKYPSLDQNKKSLGDARRKPAANINYLASDVSMDEGNDVLLHVFAEEGRPRFIQFRTTTLVKDALDVICRELECTRRTDMGLFIPPPR